ncbi:MAG: helix-turn-helix transcriptional regulator, partial [bacterium]
MSILEKIKETREDLGLSRNNLARKLKIPVDLLAFLEEPDKPTPKVVRWLCQGLGVAEETLTGKKASRDDSLAETKKMPSESPGVAAADSLEDIEKDEVFEKPNESEEIKEPMPTP